ncbi:tRNA lysidine(34) synthetase TilS [Aliivibrio fischeri]|uniref:tRNA lysidine(34) synthetase TilS n=1 Tax=Aliivibrio fischeri TaxID=668 RepID=UPI001328E66A|nr:tRNA lysidine(34) synthetase TilS [Aliivibrio fischeri]MUL22880.1 tRNA lysidine(34) synthetase TilS [Aliivibrio fischeri]MUL25325.1 tRNA lysidine(34) synthetase TilS [Aliivibrio fischeri]
MLAFLLEETLGLIDMLYSHFSQQITSYSVKKPHIVVALSGGVDSMVLLRLAAMYAKAHQLKCMAVHVNHGLSKHASDWEVSCTSYCEELGIPLCIERVNLKVSPQESLEEVARKARYHVLEKHMRANSLLLTGQHQDDQVETFFLALKRGSGPAGLSSMPSIIPLKTGYKCRPLLFTSRQQIKAYAEQHQLVWVEDESNNDIRFDRNFLRHEITPILAQRWPSFASSVSRSAQLCAEQEALLVELLRPKLEQSQNEYQGLSIKQIEPESVASRNMLMRLWLKRFGIPLPSQSQLNILWNEVAMAQQDANPCLELGNVQIRRYQGYIYCVPKYQDLSLWAEVLENKVTLPDHLGDIELRIRSGVVKEERALLLRAPLPNEKVEIRFNVIGLTPHPETRQHSRKMKKLYQEYEVPTWQRSRLPMLFYNDELAAVAGLFVCKAFSGQECELLWHKPVSE